MACQRVKAQVPEAGKIEPRLVVVVRRQVDGPPYLQVQRVEPVGASLHLGEEAMVAVADSKDTAINQYLAVSLIELANTDDVVP